jgi:hypothetical protein
MTDAADDILDAPTPPREEFVRTDAATLIRRAKRGIWAAKLARFGLLCLAIAGFMLSQGHTLSAGMGLLFATAMAWVLLVARTAKNQEDLLRVPNWIEAKQLDRAEAAVGQTLTRFSLAVQPRLQGLRLAAVSRNHRAWHADARDLAATALNYRTPKPAADALRLIIAEASLELGDLSAAHLALSSILPPLAMRDSLKLLELQTDYCVRVGAWPHAAHDLPSKVDLAELLPADHSALVQAMLALAAKRIGWTQWSTWLARRAELLVDRATLIERRPILSELFSVEPFGG